MVFLNEQAWRTPQEIRNHALLIWNEIKDCVFRGVNKKGVLPGGLNVRRRAMDLNAKGVIENALKRFFSPEFLNRIDEIVLFKPLLKKEMKNIVDIHKTTQEKNVLSLEAINENIAEI